MTIRVTVGIKALNEERHIATAIESALSAVAPLGGEVVLADSGSSDRTIEIAQSYPIRIVQLANPSERCCGAGAQLAFQHARGEFFYLMDGDMVLRPDFLGLALTHLERNPRLAAVGGKVIERNLQTEEFQIRAKAAEVSEKHRRPGLVDRLDGGGLYRSAAIREVNYFADRNLHAFEEFELSARLRANNWELARIDAAAVDHYGHIMGGYQLLWRRVRSGYAACVGEVLRSALFRRHVGAVLRLSHIWAGFIVIGWWLALAISVVLALQAIPVLLLLPILFLTYRRRSLRLGIYSWVQWNVIALGLVTGFVRRRRSPFDAIASHEIETKVEPLIASQM